MIEINGNYIRMTRGDTLRVEITMFDSEGHTYTPNESDVIRFAMKKNYRDATPLILKVIPNDTLILELEPSDTKPLSFGTYVYDIEITYADGAVDTFIANANLVLAEEVH